MTEEEFLAAQLAGQTNAYMKNILRGGSGDVHNIVGHHNRTDWRQIVANNRGQRPQYNRDDYQPNMYHPAAAGDYGDVPTEVQSNFGQIPMPRDDKGNLIVPPELRQANMLPPSDGLNIGSFQVPSYGNTQSAPKSEQYDNIIKEIKLLKRSVSALTNLVKKLIVATNPEILESSSTSKEKEKEEKDEDVQVTVKKEKEPEKPQGFPNLTFSSETKI